tara:strand:+ start:975 stop:1448 length:474 start_codon:yes stop_codon:yes gene_type:complete
MEYTITNIYNEYINENDYIDKKAFIDLCSEFNILIVEHLLDGKPFKLGNNLSYIQIVRMNRDPRSPRVDWLESNKYKKELLDKSVKLYDKETGEGQKWQIYYTDEHYFKYYWNKGKCRVPNKSVYKFTATRGLKGNKEKLTKLLKSDDLAYLKFKKL